MWEQQRREAAMQAAMDTQQRETDQLRRGNELLKQSRDVTAALGGQPKAW